MSVPTSDPTAGLGQPGDDWRALSIAAEHGRLMMEAGVAQRAAQRCREMSDTVRRHWDSLAPLEAGLWMGDGDTGNALAAKFRAKIGGQQNSVRQNFADQSRILDEMADAFEAAGRATATQEDDTAAAIAAAGVGPGG